MPQTDLPHLKLNRRLMSVFTLLLWVTPLFALGANEIDQGVEVAANSVKSSSVSKDANGTGETEESAASLIPKPELPVRTIRGGTFFSKDIGEVIYHEHRIGFNVPLSETGLKSYGFDVSRIQGGGVPWLDYEGYKALGAFDWQAFDKWNFSGNAGAGQETLDQIFNVEYDTTRTVFLYRFRTTYTPIPKTDIRAEVSDDFTNWEWTDLNGVSQVMPSNHYFTEVESFSIPGWQLRSNSNISIYWDSNRREEFDNLILRDIFTQPFLFKAGIVGGWQRFQHQVPGYWSPPYQVHYGTLFTGSVDFCQFWNFELKLGYGLHQEEDQPLFKDDSTEFHLKYKNPNGWLVAFNGNFLDANNGDWWKEDLGIDFELPF